MQPTGKDWEFLMRTLVYGLLFLAILHAFKPYITEAPAATQQEIERVMLATKTLGAQDVIEKMTHSTKPTVFLVYTSWCSYCKRTLPQVAELWRDGKMQHVQLLALSLDERLSPLAECVLESGLQDMLVPPLVLKEGDAAALRDWLRARGADYTGGIPYIGFFSAGGKFEDELKGFGPKSGIIDALEELK